MRNFLRCVQPMRYTKSVLTVLFCTVAAIGCGETRDTRASTPDNTEVNKRDRNAGEVTADQQNENTADRELTAKIRQSVMADESLSTNAQNIKIISQNGAVTLKGPVKSEGERQSIVAKAVAAAGDAGKVTDQISVTR